MQNETAAAAMESLGNPVRLSIYRLLVRVGPSGLPVGELQKRLSIPGSTLSHHIHHLVERGLILQNREGRILRCVASFQTMNELIGFLTKECCSEAGNY